MDQFVDLARRVFELHRQGDYAGALAVVDEHGEAFPARGDAVAFFRACLRARLGRGDDAVRALRQALDDGHAYARSQLFEDEDLASLAGREDFRQVARALIERHRERTRAAALPPPLVREPEPGAANEMLLVALHGNRATAADALGQWGAAVDHGWVVAALESVQATPEGPIWDDRDAATDQVVAQLNTLWAERELDPTRTVLAGFSRGAERAIWLALTGATAVSRAIAVAPSCNPVGFYDRALESGAGRGVRLEFLFGADDRAYLASGRDLAQRAAAAGIPCREAVIDDLGHAFPADFARVHLPAMLRFAFPGEAG